MTGQDAGDQDPMVGGRSREFWDAYVQGLEDGVARGARTGYDAGYREADVTLQQTVAGFLEANPPRDVIRALQARAARDEAAARPVDPRSPAQLREDAYRSWGLPPPESGTAHEDVDDDVA